MTLGKSLTFSEMQKVDDLSNVIQLGLQPRSSGSQLHE